MSLKDKETNKVKNILIFTFVVGGRTYGVPTDFVQEIIGQLPITAVPKSPSHIVGLINLRGQVAVLICLAKLMGTPKQEGGASMNVVCRTDSGPFALQVDKIGEVIEVHPTEIKQWPGSSKYLSGIYKGKDIVSVVEVSEVHKVLWETQLNNRAVAL